MAAANFDLYIEQGATFRFTMIFGHKNGQQDVDGNDIVVPYDLTGCVARMQIRQRRGSEVLISATTNNGGIVFNDDPLTGELTVTITDEATESLTVSKGKYDLEIGWPSGDVVRVLEGSVKISPNITQDADLDNVSPGVTDVFDTNEQDVDMDTLVTDQPSTAGQ
jgi:uncharacterized protein (DUF2141 family)